MSKFREKRTNKSDEKTVAIDHCQADISEVSKDIIKLKFKRSDTLGQCLNKFYDLMRKHGIRQGTPAYNDEGKRVGRTCNTSEWVICMELFKKRVDDFFTWEDLIKTPKDVAEYE